MESAPKEKNSGGGMFSRLFGGIGNMFGGAKSSARDAGGMSGGMPKAKMQIDMMNMEMNCDMMEDLSDAPDEQQEIEDR